MISIDLGDITPKRRACASLPDLIVMQSSMLRIKRSSAVVESTVLSIAMQVMSY